MTRHFCSVLLTASLALAACSPKDPKNPKFVAAKVEGEKITRAEVDERRDKALNQMNMSLQMLDESILDRITWDALQSLIDEKLVLQAAQDAKIEGAEAEAQKQLDSMKSKFPSEEIFKQRMLESGMSEADWLEQITLRITVQKLVDKEIGDAAAISEAELQEAYQTNPNFSQRPELVYVQHIFQSVPEGTTPEEKTRKKAVLQSALKRLQAGESFENLVNELSEDGSSKSNKGMMRPLQRGQAPADFEKIVFNLPENQLSPVFASSQGWHLARVLKHQKAETYTYEKAKPQIEMSLLIEKRTRATQKLREDLREKKEVQVYLPKPEERAPEIPPGAAESAPPADGGAGGS